jgi:S-adenosylmethionine:tRNA ribosyltransferase-isomerase
MRTDELDFDLPEELIAQSPPPQRSASRLLRYQRSSQEIRHLQFSDLPGLLKPGDLLVFNDARVLPAKFALVKETGGRIEGLFLDEPKPGQWQALLRNLGVAKPGMVLRFESDPTMTATVLSAAGEGEYLLEIASPKSAADILEKIGRMPLPPYIRREKRGDPRDELDRQRYQTVYAAAPGAVAAPTAGLHFTSELLKQLDQTGIERITLTLHVGLGTFKPIGVESLEIHPMHRERYAIPQEAADALNRAKSENRRIIAVGTTSARVLESQPAQEPFTAKQSETELFIYPPYQWKHARALITNFHLPRSTLIALVAGLTGLEEQRRIYREAISERYRFFSYGDAMFVE